MKQSGVIQSSININRLHIVSSKRDFVQDANCHRQCYMWFSRVSDFFSQFGLFAKITVLVKISSKSYDISYIYHTYIMIITKLPSLNLGLP